METKICTKCGEEKLSDEFHRNHMGKGGRNASCKVCKNAAARARYVPHPIIKEVTPAGTMRCSTCKEIKLEQEFSYRKKALGSQQLRAECRACQAIYKQEYYKAHRESLIVASMAAKKKGCNRNRKWVREYKQSHPCQHCGEKDFRVLIFHHLRDKSFCIATMIRNACSIERIKKEIEKCIVLCANCHSRLHYDEMND